MASILIIEDYQPLLKLYEKEFGKEGYQVVAVATTEEALQRIGERSFDAVILEIGSLYRQEVNTLIEALINGKNVPIIINTGELGRRAAHSNERINAWVIKSSDLNPLKENLKTLLKQRDRPGVLLCDSCQFYQSTSEPIGKCTLDGKTAWPQSLVCARFVLKDTEKAGADYADCGCRQLQSAVRR